MRTTLTKDEARGLAVRYAREARGLSIDQLAAMLGWHRNTVGAIENGKRPAKAVEVHGIASVLHWPVDWLETPPFPATLNSSEDPGYLNRFVAALSPPVPVAA